MAGQSDPACFLRVTGGPGQFCHA